MKRCIAIFLFMVFTSAVLIIAPEAKAGVWLGTVRGEVTQINGEIFIIQDTLGRNVRLHVTDATLSDDGIKVGDEVVARIVHKGKENYVKSFKKILTSSPSDSSSHVEGEVLKIDGDSYVVKDITGREVQLKVDGKTTKDGNITLGDSIRATVDDLASGHAERLSKN